MALVGEVTVWIGVNLATYLLYTDQFNLMKIVGLSRACPLPSLVAWICMMSQVRAVPISVRGKTGASETVE